VLAESVPPEPALADLQRMMDACAAAGADSVIAVGGGSVLDIAKGTAVLAGWVPRRWRSSRARPGDDRSTCP
jgi:alcohol dehydrogenase class IV